MTNIDIDDIVFVFSGGAGNNNADNSLGGVASIFEISSSINNLFDNISEDEVDAGRIDYRCFYLSNTSATNSLFTTTAWITDLASGGSSVALGIQTPATEVQHVTVTTGTTGGSLTLNYEGDDFTFNYNANDATWAQNFEDALNALDDISDVTVSHNIFNLVDNRFSITFGGTYDQRKHDLLTLTSNDLTGGVSVTLEKHINGSPIQTTAPLIAVDTASPTSVTFSTPTELSPITIGTIKPGDVVPFWIRRTTVAGVDAIRNDGVGFRILGTPF